MSAYSTIEVSRNRAIATIIEFTLGAGDNVLEKLLDIALESRLYNSRVVPSDGRDDMLI